MYRIAIEKLYKWKESRHRKPLIIEGARQVGKVDFLSLYPLSFKEFLIATVGERFAALLDKQDYSMINAFKQTYIDALKQYYFVGGMPEAVQSFAEEQDFNGVRRIQKRILAAYEQDLCDLIRRQC